MPEHCGDPTMPSDADALRRALEQQKERTRFLEARVSNLRARNERLLRANRLKDDFLANVSHELRTPLTSIVGWTEWLVAGGLENVPYEFQEAISIVHSSASTMAQLIQDLTDFARIQNNRLPLKRERIDLRVPLIEAVRITRRPADLRNVALHVDLPDEPLHIDADAARIRQVAWNLLTNAVKFTPPGGSVRLALRESTDGAEIAVSDTGRGIDVHALPHIFDQFWQLEHPDADPQPGLGLGLAIAHGLVAAHAGTIAVHSAGADCGAQFTIHLPIAPPPNVGVPLEAFVIDRDSVARHLIGDALDQLECHVSLFEHSSLALDALKTRRPTVVFLEVPPLDRDKIELLRFIRHTPRLAASPVIALTPAVTLEFLLEVQSADIDGFLLKPVHPTDIEGLMKQVRRFRPYQTTQE
jgi:signal transduction histidine kinase/CheY-like chemotaxis protein